MLRFRFSLFLFLFFCIAKDQPAAKGSSLLKYHLYPLLVIAYGIRKSRTQSCTVRIRGGNGFLGTSGHRQMMNPSVMHLQQRLLLELSVGLSFDQMQTQWRIDLFWLQLQASSARSCRSLARNLNFSGYTQSTCSQGGGPCEGFEKRWRTTTTSVRSV
jgi:hypothetical protein